MNRKHFLATMSAFPFLPGLLSGLTLLDKTQRSMILIWMDGGMSHIDTFDGKPEASPDIAGDLKSRESSLEGVFISQHLPLLSEKMAKMVLIRSITSPEGNHDRGSYYMLTGRRPNPVLTHPSMGSIIGHQSAKNDSPIPPYVAIPNAHTYAHQGFLSTTDGPFEVEGRPERQNFQVRNLEPHPQMLRAMELLRQTDQLDGDPWSEAEADRDRFLNQAHAISMDPQIRKLFDLKQEKPELRQQYGWHQLGQSCLLARRLVEKGVRTVFVRFDGWDHHLDIKSSLTYGFPPKLSAMDQAVAALHEDLNRRGLLDKVLVMVASEFGRTPRINPRGGRDHWPRASSALLFGTGLRSGTVVGRTDAKGESPIEQPVSPANLFSTVLSALGANLHQVLHAPNGRPVPVLDDGVRPISEVLI